MIFNGKQPQKQVKMPLIKTNASMINTQNILMCGVLGLGLLTTSCGSLPKESATAQSRRPRGGDGGVTAVDVAIAKTNQLTPTKDYTGNTAPYRTVSVRSQVEGRLLALNVDVGDRVRQGQVIGQLDDTLLLSDLREAEAELAARQSEVARANTQVGNAKAEVERARLELVQAQADFRRFQKLYKEGAIAEQAAQQAQTRSKTNAQLVKSAIEQVANEQQSVAATKGRVIAQQAVVKSARERRSYARVISPITGIIQTRTDPGNLLQPGGLVVEIGDFSRVKVEVRVSEQDIGEIQIGQAAQVSFQAFPEQTFMGRVSRINPSTENTPLGIPVEVLVPNNGEKLVSGLLAKVNFSTQDLPRVVVPEAAINSKESQDKQSEKSEQNQTKEINNGTIFVVEKIDGKTKVKAQSVTLGKRFDGKVEILSGLQPDESYVVRSSNPLKDGEEVKMSVISETKN